MRSLYMFLLFLLFTSVEMLLFHVNVFAQLSQHENEIQLANGAHPEPRFEPNTNKQHGKRESLYIEGLEAPPPKATPESKAKPPSVKPTQPAKRQSLSEIRVAKEKQRYNDALAKGMAKTVNVSRMWFSDPDKYECFMKSDFTCHKMPISDMNLLPEPFREACAPEFLIVGTAKSGTTSLYFYLVEHPQVHQALSGQFNKEVRFFNEQWSKGAAWYQQQFPPISSSDFPLDRKVHMIAGEASPTYFYDINVPARVKQATPDAKLIVVLRDPVERAYSDKMQLVANRVQYKADPYEDMKFQMDIFNPCLEKARSKYNTTTEAFFSCYGEPKFAHRVIRSHPYVMDSIYIYQVRNWLKYFPREQIMFIKGEDMYTDAMGVMNKVTKWLGLCDFDWAPFVKKIHNKREKGYPPMAPKVRELLTNFYKPFTQELYYELGHDFNWTSTNT